MIMAFTGAGISAASGIPTFQDQEGIRDKLERGFATKHPEEYNEVITKMKETCDKAEPNDAHIALAEYKIPVITMNVDELHQRAGTKNIIPVHGTFPNIVLYGDPAPNYQLAYDWVNRLMPGDMFIIIGTSYYTNISFQLKMCALSRGADVIEINQKAETEVRKTLEMYKREIENFDVWIHKYDSEEL